MLAVQLKQLVDGAPEAVGEALDLVTGVDDALVHGLARLSEHRAGALSAFAGALGASPLGVPVAEAAEKVTAGSIGDDQLAALAGARTALLGAVHDALLERLDGALGRTRAFWEENQATTETPDNLLSGARSWLHELAISGWRGVDHDLVSAADQTIEALWDDPALRRLAVLLDGLASELRASSPIATMDRVPARRWADLWSRAVLLARSGPWTNTTRTVSGRLLVLGVDVHEHGTAVQVQIHAVLESGGTSSEALTSARLVRASVAAAKVDTIVGPAVWRLLNAYPVLMTALAERRVLTVSEMPLTSGGDLLWRDDLAQTAEPAEPFTTARIRLGEATAPPVPPLDRHPVRISEPVLLEGYACDGDTVTLDDITLDIDTGRLPTCGPITPSLVKASTACIGLVRWDGGRWLLQPLAVQSLVKKKPVEAHTGDWALGPTDPKVVKAEARAGDAVAVLRERAGRLLRK